MWICNDWQENIWRRQSMWNPHLGTADMNRWVTPYPAIPLARLVSVQISHSKSQRLGFSTCLQQNQPVREAQILTTARLPGPCAETSRSVENKLHFGCPGGCHRDIAWFSAYNGIPFPVYVLVNSLMRLPCRVPSQFIKTLLPWTYCPFTESVAQHCELTTSFPESMKDYK